MLTPEMHTTEAHNIVEHPWIMEALQEKFADALVLLDEECIVYGGALRDLLAGLPIGGDLDLAIPQSHMNTMRGRFNDSVRWKSENQPGVPKLALFGGSGTPTTAKKVISKVDTYHNIDGDIVQLISPNTNSSMTLSGINIGIIEMAKNVDIMCCGLLMDSFGNVHEIVPGAIKDSQKRVLNLNNEIQMTDSGVERLAERIKKLVARGWTNNIDTSKIKTVKGETHVKEVPNHFRFTK